MNITFKSLEKSHFSFLLKWLELPHVKLFWDPEIHWTPSLIEKKYESYVQGYKSENGSQKPIQAFVIYLDDIPIGYIQLYNAHDFPRSVPLRGLPQKLGAFDIFIGEKDHMAQGVGSRAIKQFLDLYAR